MNEAYSDIDAQKIKQGLLRNWTEICAVLNMDPKSEGSSQLSLLDQNRTRDLFIEVYKWEQSLLEESFESRQTDLAFALYAAIRQIRHLEILSRDFNPRIDNHFHKDKDFFADNYFLAVALARVLNIFSVNFPDQYEAFQESNGAVSEKVIKFRNSMEHSNEIKKGKDAPRFFNNFTSQGFQLSARTEGPTVRHCFSTDGTFQGEDTLTYAEMVSIIHKVMNRTESRLGNR